MCAIPQLVSAPLNPILVSEAFLWQPELKLFACCTEGVGQNTVRHNAPQGHTRCDIDQTYHIPESRHFATPDYLIFMVITYPRKT